MPFGLDSMIHKFTFAQERIVPFLKFFGIAYVAMSALCIPLI
jgi:uncharacterized protein (DUF488 family)